MKRLRFSQEGDILIIVIAILAFAVVGGMTWYIWRSQNDASKVANNAASQSKSSTVTSTAKQATQTKADEDLTKLPLGDGRVSLSPQQGYVYSCNTSFRGGGAQHAGNWIGTTTWNATTKPAVNGSVLWPDARASITLSGSSRIISGNGLPVQMPTGVFPIQAGTTAYQYDTNPNSIKAQQVLYTLPANPTTSANPTCVPMGVIGYTTNGVAIFNALDDGGRDAVAHEIQDSCGGHPQMQGVYHFHGMSGCIASEDAKNTLIGYALDGFGIFSDRDASGNQYTSADLDACHGTTSAITWDGKMVTMYHYVLTHDYPYTVGCFRDTPVRTGASQ